MARAQHFVVLAARANRILDDRYEAEDIVEEALIRYGLHQGPIATPIAWLTKVVRDLAHDRRKKLQCESPANVQGISLGTAPDALEDQAFDRIELSDTLKQISAMPDRSRRALTLAAEGIPRSEIAEALRTTTDNARQLISRTRRALKRTNGDQGRQGEAP